MEPITDIPASPGTRSNAQEIEYGCTGPPSAVVWLMQRVRDVLGFQIGDGTAQITTIVIACDRVGRANVAA